MAEKMSNPSKPQVPDPSDTYERAHPEHESGQGRMDNNSKATPTARPDKLPTAVANAQDGGKQINAHEPAVKKESSMKNEPLGWAPEKKKQS